jgi:hypothetical protein
MTTPESPEPVESPAPVEPNVPGQAFSGEARLLPHNPSEPFAAQPHPFTPGQQVRVLACPHTQESHPGMVGTFVQSWPYGLQVQLPNGDMCMATEAEPA